MVYFKDSQTWLQQSSLLIEARPTTTRITTRYSLVPLSKLHVRNPRKAAPTTTAAAVNPAVTAEGAPPPSRAYIILKTYDPVSGTCLQYRTDKAAEIGRLVSGLGRCARTMAALPPQDADHISKETGEGETTEGGREVKAEGRDAVIKESGKEGKPPQGKAGGGGKKKKGKR